MTASPVANMRAQSFVVSLYAIGERRAADCLPEFFATRSEAMAAGRAEVDRVATMPADARDPTLDWAARFTVRRVLFVD